jgi:hypothetical protein
VWTKLLHHSAAYTSVHSVAASGLTDQCVLLHMSTARNCHQELRIYNATDALLLTNSYMLAHKWAEQTTPNWSHAQNKCPLFGRQTKCARLCRISVKSILPAA